MPENLRKAVTVLLTIFALSSNGQGYQWEAKLEQKPANNGFYSVALAPSVTCLLESGYSNLRLIDKNGKEVPYLIKHEVALKEKEFFKPYSLNKKEIRPGCCTELVLQNPEKKKINNLTLVIKNAEVFKEARLSGSDDMSTWYSVKDKFYLTSISAGKETSELSFVNFPLSDYRYFKIEINDSATAPINILAAGYYDLKAQRGKYREIANINFTVKDSSDKRSYIHIDLKNEHYVDNMVFNVEGSRFFKRSCVLSVKQIQQLKRNKTKELFIPIQTFDLSSGRSNTVNLNSLKTKDLYLTIENEDNQPLKIHSIQAFQLASYLVADLKKNEEYKLKVGPADMPAPSYDVKYFADSIPSNLAMIDSEHPTLVQQRTAAADSGSFFTSRIFIWVSIILVILLLGYMSIAMVKDMKK